MQMLYNSDSFVVVHFDLPGDAGEPGRGGYEIVDKHTRREIYIEGAVAEGFKQGVQALVDKDAAPDGFDDFIGTYASLAQQPLTLH